MSEREAAPPPAPEQRRAAAAVAQAASDQPKRLLWLMSQLLERQLAQSTAAEEPSDESE